MDNQKIIKGKVIFTGNFIDFAVKFILLFILSILTLGLGFAYLSFWSVKYFVDNLEIEILVDTDSGNN